MKTNIIFDANKLLETIDAFKIARLESENKLLKKKLKKLSKIIDDTNNKKDEN